MASPTLPREGCFVGGLMTDRFTVQCRSDQDTDISVEVSRHSDFRTLAGSSTTESVVTDTHWRGTATVTGLSGATRYYWRIKMDNGADAVTYGDNDTGTAGSLKTHSTKTVNWSFARLGCYHPNATQNDAQSALISNLWQSLYNKMPDFMIHQDDIYYSDNGPGFPSNTVGGGANVDYDPGHFFNLSPADPTHYTLAHYRTNFITTYSTFTDPGDQLTSAGEGGARTTTIKGWDKLCHANIPSYYMWGDHDRAFDDCAERVDKDEVSIGAGDELDRWNAGRDAGHELFMNMNAPLINGETGRSWTPYTTEEAYYYIDIKPMRLIVLDDASWRTALDGADDSTDKQLLGVTQEAWALDLIANNPEKFLVISLAANLAGNHGWNKDLDWTWEFSSYARKTLLDAIWATGNAHRTLILTGDTHELACFKHEGANFDQPAIYELAAGNSSYLDELHGFINGLNTGTLTVGSSLQGMWVNARGYILVEHTGGRLKASIISCEQIGGSVGGATPAKVLYQRWFN